MPPYQYSSVSESLLPDNGKLKQQIAEATGNDFNCCYQCGKCTAGCPAGNFMDNPPTRIMRLVQAGYIEEA